MSLGKVSAVAMGIIYVALVFVLVSHPTTVGLVNAAGGTFVGALRAAMGG